MKMRLIAKYADKAYFLPDCEYSKALFELISLKSGKIDLNPTDLEIISRMGYEIDINGTTRPLVRDLNMEGIKNDFENGLIKI